MNFYLREILLFSSLTFACCLSSSYAQKQKSAHFIGMNPGISIKPFYESGEMDMNIIPIVYQTRIYKQMDIRLISIMNFGFRKDGNKIINYGLELALPYLFGQRSQSMQVSQGFYLAPVFSLLRYNGSKEYNSSLLIEPGIIFRLEEKASISVGLQLGAGYYNLEGLDSNWQNQVGLKIILGNWF